jgi:hypothetical protein
MQSSIANSDPFEELFPQGLEPKSIFAAFHVRAEARTLQIEPSLTASRDDTGTLYRLV